MLPRNSNRQKSIAVIVNPSSAGGKTLLRWPEFEQSLITAGFSVTKHFSTSESDFREAVRYFSRKFKMIGVCGGDSSLTIAAEELQEKKFRGELVFFPAGSVNDLVLAIGAHSLKPRSIFLGNLEGPADQKLFIGQANWGLGVVVNRWVGKILAALPFLRPVTGLIGFVCIVVAHVLHRELVEAEIIAGKSRSKDDYSIIIVSQISHWASGLNFCPGASYASPVFQVVTVKRCGLLRLIRIILAAKNGGHLAFDEVSQSEAATVTLHFAWPQAVQVDGDILRAAGAEVLAADYSLGKLKTGFTLSLPAAPLSAHP